MATAVEDRDEWIAWQTRQGGHGRDGDALRKLLTGRWYRIAKSRRVVEAALARNSNARAAAAAGNGDEEEGGGEGEGESDGEGVPKAPEAPGAPEVPEVLEGVDHLDGPGEDPAGDAPGDLPQQQQEGDSERQQESGQDDGRQQPRPALGGKSPRIAVRAPGRRVRTPTISELSGPLLTKGRRGEQAHGDAEERAVMENPPNFREADGWALGWNTGEKLGYGGQGAVYIYCREENNVVVDRVVVKETFVNEHIWGRFYHWYGDPRDAKNRTHVEIKCMQVIKDRPGSDKCVVIRGEPEVSDERMWYRIYMEFCPNGDLDALIADAAYHKARDIPEPAIWSFLNDIVDAFLLLQYGGVEEGDQDEDWERIVHRDIKLKNFLLDMGYPDGEFSSYPTAKICDFGGAIITHDDDAMNPAGYSDGWGTRAWLAPEQQLYRHKTTLEPVLGEKLGEKTNVWGMGATIMRLMNHERDPKRPQFKNNRPDEPTWRPNQKQKYSSELTELVEWCVRFKPADRPNLRQVKQRIFELTTPGGDVDLARGFRIAPHDDDDDDDDEDSKLYYRADEKYRLALATS